MRGVEGEERGFEGEESWDVGGGRKRGEGLSCGGV